MQYLAKNLKSASTFIVDTAPDACPKCQCQRFEKQHLSAVDKLLKRRARFKCLKCTTYTVVCPKPDVKPAVEDPQSDPFLDGGYEYLLGNKYLKGVQVPKNENKAFEHYLKSAQLGNSDGQYNAGLCYRRGIGVEADIVMAYYWVGRAAEKGHGHAVRLLPSLEPLFAAEEVDLC